MRVSCCEQDGLHQSCISRQISLAFAKPSLRRRRLGHVEAERILREATVALHNALSFAERGLPPPPPRGGAEERRRRAPRRGALMAPWRGGHAFSLDKRRALLVSSSFNERGKAPPRPSAP